MSVAWPLKYGPPGTSYLVDQNGIPFRIHGQVAWICMQSFSSADFSSFVSNLVSQGINTIQTMLLDHDFEDSTGKSPGTAPRDVVNSNWPFSLDTTGAAYAGTGITSTSGEGTQTTPITADMSTTLNAYFADMDAFLATLLSNDILVLLFPCYFGFGGFMQGWAADMTASGATKCGTYGTFVGNRYKNQNNLIWMFGGDFQSPPSTLQTCQNTVMNNIRAAGANQIFAGHFPIGHGIPTDSVFASQYTNGNNGANSIYVWTDANPNPDTNSYLFGQASAGAGLPYWYTDAISYEGGSGNTQRSRQNYWWSALTAPGGVVWANDLVSHSGTLTFSSINTTSGLQSTGSAHIKNAGAFFAPLQWWKLVPAQSRITSGGGTSGQLNYVTCAADPGGTALVAYIPPGGGTSITVTMGGFVSSQVKGQWYDPTAGTFTTIATTLTNTGSMSFTTPGNNSAGVGDWVLLLTSSARRDGYVSGGGVL